MCSKLPFYADQVHLLPAIPGECEYFENFFICGFAGVENQETQNKIKKFLIICRIGQGEQNGAQKTANCLLCCGTSGAKPVCFLS